VVHRTAFDGTVRLAATFISILPNAACFRMLSMLSNIP
jgi:hypothetical protein